MRANQEKQRAKAVNAAVAKAKTGMFQIAIEFQFLDEPGGITYYGPLSDAALEYTMKAIRTAGFVGADLSDLSSLCDGSAPEVVLIIEPDEYEGKVTRKVKFINSLGGLAVKDALQGSDLKSFAQSMKGKILAYDQSTGGAKPKPQPKRPAAPSRGPDDEQSPFNDGSESIPF